MSDSDGYLALSEQLEDKQFAERSIRNWVGDQGDLQTASERLGHASTATTKKHYIDSESTVVPITVQLKQ